MKSFLSLIAILVGLFLVLLYPTIGTAILLFYFIYTAWFRQ